MLRTELMALTDMTRRAFPNPREASAVTDFVIASCIARLMPLPSSAVESDAAYFATSYAEQVTTLANGVSLMVLANTGRILTMTRLIWCYRYQAVFGRAYPNPAMFELDLSAFDPDLAAACVQVRAFLRTYPNVFQKLPDALECDIQASATAA